MVELIEQHNKTAPLKEILVKMARQMRYQNVATVKMALFQYDTVEGVKQSICV